MNSSSKSSTENFREKSMSDRVTELEAEVARLISAIEWALGEGDSNFSPPTAGSHSWWRKELRERAFPPPVCIKGLDVSTTTGGFANIEVNGKIYTAREILQALSK